jgi:hypothetical protein
LATSPRQTGGHYSWSSTAMASPSAVRPNLMVNRTRRFIPSFWRASARRAGYLQR